MSFDGALLQAVLQLRRPWLDEVMIVASALGAGGYIWFVVATIAMVFPPRRPAAWRVLLTIWFTSFIVDWVIKPFVDRARPFDVVEGIQLLDQRPISESFPSGHAAMAFAGAVALSRLFPACAWLWWPLATLVAVSRIYLGVHWPSDVVAGLLIGFASATFVLGGWGSKVQGFKGSKVRGEFR